MQSRKSFLSVLISICIFNIGHTLFLFSSILSCWWYNSSTVTAFMSSDHLFFARSGFTAVYSKSPLAPSILSHLPIATYISITSSHLVIFTFLMLSCRNIQSIAVSIGLCSIISFDNVRMS